MIEWTFKPFAVLSAMDLYDILTARSDVFVIEQQCNYRDIDGLDVNAWHLLAYDTAQTPPALAGYLRVLLPNTAVEANEDGDLAIGRVLTTRAHRGRGLGKALLDKALGHIETHWPNRPVRLHAQAHLQRFYARFGFMPVSDVHDEGGIPHLWMRRA